MVALVAGTAQPARPASAVPQPQEESGVLRDFIAAYKTDLPGEGSGAFIQPSEAELGLMVEVAGLALTGQLEAAAAGLVALGYEFVLFRDTEAGGSHLMLRERVPCGRCWGLYLMSLSPGARNVAIEVPHPVWDTFTPELGIEAYLHLDARAFLMAGAHRYANGRGSPVSDMTRNGRSLFQVLHEVLADRYSQVLQLHGFNLQSHPGYPNVVLSNGSPEPHAELLALKTAIEARGESVGIYDGRSWAALGATGNPQARHTRAIGGRFCHLETRWAIRNDPARRAALVDAALAALFL